MKRFIGVLAVIFLLASAQAVSAQKIGIGVFVGPNIPVSQDAGNGSQWGIRGQIQAVPLVRLEPFISFIKNGDFELLGITVTPGGKINALGVEGILGTPMGGPGIGVGLVAGIGTYKLKPVGGPDVSHTGYTGGLDLGVGIGPMPVRASARGTLLVIPRDGESTLKHLLLSVGITYSIGR